MPNVTDCFLGIEGGGTRTVALLADAEGRELQRAEFGPGNFRLLGDRDLSELLRAIRSAFPQPRSIGAALAGVREDLNRERLRRAVARVWQTDSILVGNDLETALLASRKSIPEKFAARIVVISGTGSCVFGAVESATAEHRRSRENSGLRLGKTAKIGGWGHLLGDKGSGHEIGLRALKAVLYYFDRDGEWPRLGQALLRTLQLNAPDDLIPWAQTASKRDIAALAPEVFAAARRKDQIASDILAGAQSSLAKDAVACAARLAKPEDPVLFVLCGSVLLRQPRFAEEVARQIVERRLRSEVKPLAIESVWGAVEMARCAAIRSAASDVQTRPRAKSRRSSPPISEPIALPAPTGLSPTEQRNPRSAMLHRMPLRNAVALILDEEGKVAEALRPHARRIESAVRLISASLKNGGRLFYVGAGTSGRLGVLDASECPPTFRTDPDIVQGIIAGGQQALWRAIEGAEDDGRAGAEAVRFRGVRAGDVVAGIAASGRTPFVWGALHAARELAAKTILLCFNPHLSIPRAARPDIVIAANLGPEILTGSTRLKAGTATKVLLNTLSTLTMVRLGKVMGNLMVDLNPSNAKLRARAVRIVCELTGVDADAASEALQKHGWMVKSAVQSAGSPVPRRIPKAGN